MAEGSTKVKVDTLITNAAEVVTCIGETLKDIGLQKNVWIAIVGDNIAGVGSEAELQQRFDWADATILDATGKVVAPGFVDSHTHLIFYGTRAEEYAAKIAGINIQQLLDEGLEVGPSFTIEMTRNQPAEVLFQQAKKRVLNMLDYGITTIESKSGYGLTTESEIKILEVSRRLDKETPLDVLNTFLGAHGIPENMTKEQYIEEIIHDMIPKVQEKGLAEFCDVWCDEGYFTAEESRRILEAGLQHGMKAKIHADAYSYIGGSDLAAEMKMVSIDHLNYTPVEVMHKLAEAGVTGVLMPALDFAVAHKRPFDARTMLDSGMNIALATDFCGACYTESMQFVINLACRLYHFTVEEAIKAATYGGAQALALDDRGTIEEGKLADLQIWDMPTYKHIAYELGTNAVETVIKKGKVVVQHRKH